MFLIPTCLLAVCKGQTGEQGDKDNTLKSDLQVSFVFASFPEPHILVIEHACSFAALGIRIN